MIKISKEQALKRWGTLPDNLREAVLSAYNAEILWRVCENQHLSEDKIGKVAIAAGDVLMGFVHPEDFASEIREALNINVEIANAVAAEINRKIFSPLKKELRKIYVPAVAASFAEVATKAESAEEGQPSEEELTVLDLRERTEEPSFKIIEDENQKQENKIDLSKEIKKENIMAPQVEPIIEKITPAVEKTEESARGGPSLEADAPSERAFGEKEEKKAEELKVVEPISVSFEMSVPVVPAEPSKEEGPLIIHKEIGFKPLSGKLKSLGGMFNFLRGKDEFKKEEEPVKAELDIGEEFKIAEGKSARGGSAYGGKEEYKPQIKINELNLAKKENSIEAMPVDNNIISDVVKVVNYAEAPAEPAKEKETIAVPENLPVTKETFEEVKPEVGAEKKIEEKKPEAGESGKPEEMVDLGDFK